MDQMKALPNISSLEDLCNELHEVFKSDSVNVEYVHHLMSSYKSNIDDWKKYAKFDMHRYTRNLVDAGNGKFNLMIVCWNEAQGSSIHDHSNSHCFMKALLGELREIRFAWPSESDGDASLQEIGCTKIGLGEVSYMSDSLGLHRVENPSHTEKAVSLHLYCPPYSSCHMFDQRTGHKALCQVTFWSKHGERTQYITETAPEND